MLLFFTILVNRWGSYSYLKGRPSRDERKYLLVLFSDPVLTLTSKGGWKWKTGTRLYEKLNFRPTLFLYFSVSLSFYFNLLLCLVLVYKESRKIWWFREIRRIKMGTLNTLLHLQDSGPVLEYSNFCFCFWELRVQKPYFHLVYSLLDFSGEQLYNRKKLK